MADYPGAVPAKPSINTADMSASTSHSVDRGLLWDELRAIAIELGTTPSGSFSTVRARLEDIEADVADKVSDTGGTITGAVLINAASGDPLAIRKSGSIPFLDLDSDAGATLFRLSATTSDATIGAQNSLIFQSDATSRARIVGTAFLFGKTTSDLSATGVEVFVTGSTALGSIRSTTSAAGIQNLYLRHEGSANANTQAYAQYLEGSNVLGSVTQVNTTGVAFNTTSDQRLKTVLRDLDDDEVATILRLIAPVVFEFNSEPGVEHVGFIAQQLAETWPQFVDVGIVTVGHGEPGDEVEQREIRTPILDANGEQRRDENGEPMDAVTFEPVPGTEFRPWMVDLSKLTPLLVAGWQALDRRVATLEDAA